MPYDKYAAAYSVLSRRLINAGVITREQCNTIARAGHRKQQYWRRHIIDLCEYVLGKLEREGIDNAYVTSLCDAGKRIATQDG